jgi:hypothetical protein
MAHTINLHVAGRLEEAARLLRNQGSDPYRVRAYRRAATVVRGWALPVDEVFRRQGLGGLKALPFGEKRLVGIRDSLAHRLQRVHLPATGGPLPPVSELLDVDRHAAIASSRAVKGSARRSTLRAQHEADP